MWCQSNDNKCKRRPATRRNRVAASVGAPHAGQCGCRRGGLTRRVAETTTDWAAAASEQEETAARQSAFYARQSIAITARSSTPAELPTDPRRPAPNHIYTRPDDNERPTSPD